LPEREGIVSICVDMQMRVTQLAQKYQDQQKRFYYVTPTSYLVLIKAFKDLLDKKRKSIDTVIMKYDKGINQLANAKSEVGILQEKLVVLMPQFTQAKKETAEKIIEVDIQKKEVAEIRKGVEAEEAVAKEKKGNADTI
jgi:dynein heavy chain